MIKDSRFAALAITLVAFLLGLPTVGAAQQPTEDSDWRFTWRIGGQFFNSFNSRVRVDATEQAFGTVLNLEDDLALEENVEVLRVDGIFWYGRRSSIALSHYDIKRSGFETIEKDIDFGGDFIPIHTNVVTTFNQRIEKFAYRYQFVDKPRVSLGGSIGLHRVAMEMGLRGDGGNVNTSAEADVPLPLIGVHGAYRFKPRWRVAGTFEIFDVHIGDTRGTFNDSFLAVEYDMPGDRFGVGVGFNRARLKVSIVDSGLRGTVFELYDAGLIYVKGRVGPRQRASRGDASAPITRRTEDRPTDLRRRG